MPHREANRKTHRTAVVIIPPEDSWQPIQEIRAKHDRHFRRWMPHITMTYPFRPREQFDKLAEQFHFACQKIQPFQIRFASFNYFHHRKENYTIWLKPESKEPIIDLQNSLLNLVPDCDNVKRFKSGFTPHLSVGQVKGKSLMLELKNGLQASWNLLVFEVNEICFIWRNVPPDDVFRVSHRIKLNALSLSTNKSIAF